MILDTNGVTAWADGNEAVEDLISQPAMIALHVIVLGEYRFGISISRDRDILEERLARLEQIVTILNIDQETALHYSAIQVALRKIGRPIPTNDAWIAALALQHNMPVLSRDKHFDVVAGIRRISW